MGVGIVYDEVWDGSVKEFIFNPSNGDGSDIYL